MKKASFISLVALISLGFAGPVLAKVAVGVNVVDTQIMSAKQHDDLIETLVKNHVKVVRCGLTDKSLDFITKAAINKIGVVAIVVAQAGGSEKHMRPADAARGFTWKEAPLSDSDPKGFAGVYGPLFARLDETGTKLAAIECGNEINSANYNGDFPLEPTGRFLGPKELHDTQDHEGAAVAAGYRKYIDVLKELKSLRSATTANKLTPILSAGMVTMGPPKQSAGIKKDGASNRATIGYMREHGLDKVIDGYGVHVYPSSDPKLSLATVLDRLEADTFAANGAGMGKKPIWITEWGFDNNSPECPLKDDEPRRKLVQRERTAFKQFASQGRLAAILWYSWDGHLSESHKLGSAIFRCGEMTAAGRNALMTMDND